MELIQAGFRPESFKPLSKDLRFIIDVAIEAAIEEFRLPMPEGTAIEALVIPGSFIYSHIAPYLNIFQILLEYLRRVRSFTEALSPCAKAMRWSSLTS